MKKRIVSSSALIILLVVAGSIVWFVVFSPYKLYIVHTGSMVPAEPVRSVEVVHEGQYHVGQVVSYSFNGEAVAHRLISINSEGLITTKGDANRSADPWHPSKSSIIGGVVTTIPYLGWVLVYFQQPTGLASLALALFIAWLLWDLLPEPTPEVKV